MSFKLVRSIPRPCCWTPACPSATEIFLQLCEGLRDAEAEAPHFRPDFKGKSLLVGLACLLCRTDWKCSVPGAGPSPWQLPLECKPGGAAGAPEVRATNKGHAEARPACSASHQQLAWLLESHDILCVRHSMCLVRPDCVPVGQAQKCGAEVFSCNKSQKMLRLTNLCRLPICVIMLQPSKFIFGGKQFTDPRNTHIGFVPR